MSDNKTVPSAEEFIEQNKTLFHQQAMIGFTRLHLEAMAKEIAYNMFDTKYRDIVMNKATNYISKIK